jgi:fimbrial isopeptide formation D2 family protein/LPXTG-motif cell wall-anchored protein
MTNPAGTDWMDTVHVYPKDPPPITLNKELSVLSSGSLTDLPYAHIVGQPFTYTLTSGIPQISAADGPITKYVITDTLDGRLAYHGNQTAKIQCLVGGPLTSGSDYVFNSANPLTWTFSQDGLDRINDLIGDGEYDCQVVITFDVVATTLGQIPNGGQNAGTTLVWATDGDDNSQDYPEVDVKLGGEALHKFDFTSVNGSNTAGTPLAGAQFMLFGSAADARACSPVKVGSNWSCDNNLIRPLQFFTNTVNGGVVQNGFVNSTGLGSRPDYNTPVTVATSAADGTAFICGLAYGTYYALEVQAPSGFELLTEPLVIVIDSTLDFDAWTGTNTEDDFGVPNVPENAGFDLPLTGGTGTSFLTILSIGIAVVGTGVVLRRKAKSVA